MKNLAPLKKLIQKWVIGLIDLLRLIIKWPLKWHKFYNYPMKRHKCLKIMNSQLVIYIWKKNENEICVLLTIYFFQSDN